MRTNDRNLVLWAAGAAAAVNVGLGILLPQPLVAAGGALGLAYVASRVRQTLRPLPEENAPIDSPKGPPPRRPPCVANREPDDPADTAALVETMLAQGRYALLLRPQIAANLADGLFQRALGMLEEEMSLVPDGEVVVGQVDDGSDRGGLDEDELAARCGRVVQVERFFLDRYPVTNAQYHAFVAAGGYSQAALWDPTILPAVLDFVDQTGQPGPRFWRGGCYEPGREDHPVVGVSWYEAAAYARWIGKRLPTDAEWVKAGSWPVNLSLTTRLQRRYPWGDTMERSRANLWGAGPGGTVAVHEFARGASVGGVYQLIGNVWEWMRGDFVLVGAADGPPAEMCFKSIRGGAFDTYFESQATCQFQSGEAAIARKQNIGFRCAASVCDVVLCRPAADTHPAYAAESPAPSEEVQA